MATSTANALLYLSMAALRLRTFSRSSCLYASESLMNLRTMNPRSGIGERINTGVEIQY